MIESIEKLRELREEVASKMVDNPRWVCARAEEIADEIEREIAERYMELPVDADGVPVRPREEVSTGMGDDGPIGHLEYWYPNCWVAVIEYKPGQFTRYDPAALRHVKPRTLEDVLEEFAHKAVRIGMVGGVPCDAEFYADKDAIAEYAAEIRELMEASE